MLALTWLVIIAFCIIMYVILDGFTLGTGIMLLFFNEHEKDLAMSVILPTWDGNQTWLVLGSAALYGAFPLAFSILLPALYLPLLIMVVGILLRGVAFEFRLKSPADKEKWSGVFIIASIVVTLTQGFILGNFVQGFTKTNEIWTATSHFDLFSIGSAVSLVIGYSLLGSTRLILKTSGDMQKKMYKAAIYVSLLLMLAIFVISLSTPFVYPLVQKRWFNLALMPYLAILPFITGVTFCYLIFSLYKRYERRPYWLSVILFLCPYFGFLISIFPYIVPYQITLWQAASPDSSLKFILVGAIIMLPVLLVYTGYSYHVFKGKVNEKLHY
jgi:cytochrome bd ubiquinol oxidase subunit II